MLLSTNGHEFVRTATGLELRVLVDGQDVTGDCVAADDVHGWATVLVRHPSDPRLLVANERHGCPQALLLVGTVEFAIYEDAQPVLRRIPRVVLPTSPLVVLH